MLTLVASALAGGDCIDDADVLRTGGQSPDPGRHGQARIHRRDTAVALTRGMMGTGRRTGRARSRSMGLRVVGGGHASGQVAAGSGGGRRKRPGGMPEVALAGWAGMSLRDSPWGCPVDGSGADGAPSGW